MNLRACLYFAFKIKDGLFIGDINSPNTIIDDNNENMQLIYEFMSRAYDNCESVLVCSVRGQSRALTVITAFLMKRYQWSLYKTLEYMNSKRADFEIRATFLKQLLSYEQKLFGQKGCSRNWKDDNQHPDHEASLVRNTYVNSQMICIESRDFFMRSLASREYTQGARSTKLKWSMQLKMEIPHEELSNVSKIKQNNGISSQVASNNGNSANNNSNNANNTGSNQSMKNSSNWTANSSNQMDSIEILPINQNAFQAPKKSILKTVSAYDKKNANGNTNNTGQNSLTSLSDDGAQNNQQIQQAVQKRKESKKTQIQKSYDLIEEQNEEYEQSSSEIFLSKSKQKNNQPSPSPLQISNKPLNDLEKELLVEGQQSSRSYDTNSSGERVEQGINVIIETDASRNSNDIETNRLGSTKDEVVPILRQPVRPSKDRNEIKIFEQNIDRMPKPQQNPPAAPTYATSAKPYFQIQKEKKKNNYFTEENNNNNNNDIPTIPSTSKSNNAPTATSSTNNTTGTTTTSETTAKNNTSLQENPSLKNNNTLTEEVRIIADEENENGEEQQQYMVDSLENKTNNNSSIPPKSNYQILNDQQIRNSANFAQYQINSRQNQSLISQPGSNNSSRQTTPSRKYRKSPFPMAMPQRKIIQSQTAPASKDNSRKNSIVQVDPVIPIERQSIDKRSNIVKQIISKSPDSSQLQVNINLNINSVNILNQTTNPIYSRQKSPADSDSQNVSMLNQSIPGRNSRKTSRPPSESKKRPNTEKVYTEGNQIKDLEFLKPSSTRLTRRLQTYTNGDPLTFLPNITFMRQKTPLKNNINLPNTQNIVPKQQQQQQHKNLELSFQDITSTPNNNQAYLLNNSQNPNSQQLYTNYLNDVDITSQQNTSKSNATNKQLKGFKRDNTPVMRNKIQIPSPYHYENRSNSTFDQRRVSTEFGQQRGSELKGKRSVSRGKEKEKEFNNTFTYLTAASNNNSGANTPVNTSINNQLIMKYGKNTLKPTYNKLLY